MSKVYLVGAGPGDPELLTLKGKRVLATADCVLYDNLANEALLDFAPPSAELLYVGKKKSNHSMPQDEISELLVERGRRGLNVVRLKGGDPYLFGRGGEEAEALADAGIPFEVVSGVSSALGIAAYTGVPLTHRDHTSVVTFVTGHDVEKIDWMKVGTAETLVIFMGLSYFEAIAERIIAGGRSPETPAMCVRWGTRPDQEVITGTLATLPGLVRQAGMKPPASFIVGGVVELREKLNWFEHLPLFGLTIVVTRPKEQAAALSQPLRELGAHVVEMPAIEIRPPESYSALDSAIAELGSYDWLLFTSANGVRAFFERLRVSTVDTRAIRGKIGAIGPATRDALAEHLLKVDVMADEFVAEGLLRALEAYSVAGQRILLARAAVARDVLPMMLRERGALVDVVEAYQTLAPENLAARAKHVLEQAPDWIVFTSSSTVQNTLEATGTLHGVRAMSIGPVTSATLRKNNIEPAAEASEYTVDGIIAALRAQARRIY